MKTELALVDPACVGADVDVFFPVGRGGRDGHSGDAEPALEYCRRCPAVRQCLAYALTHLVDGVWGGTTPQQRAALREKYGVTAEAFDVEVFMHPAREEGAA